MDEKNTNFNGTIQNLSKFSGQRPATNRQLYDYIYIYRHTHTHTQPDKFAIFESPFHRHFVAMKKGHTQNIAHILYCDILFLLTFISVSAPPQCLLQWHMNDSQSFCQKCRWQVTIKHTVQAQCRNPLGKRAHTQLVKERSSTVASARRVTVDSSLAKYGGTGASELIPTIQLTRRNKTAQARNDPLNPP